MEDESTGYLECEIDRDRPTGLMSTFLPDYQYISKMIIVLHYKD